MAGKQGEESAQHSALQVVASGTEVMLSGTEGPEGEG